MCFPSNALAQTSLSRPGGPQVTPNNLEPDPEFRERMSPKRQLDNKRGNNLEMHLNYFRSTLTDKEMDEMDRLKSPKADGGQGMNEAEAREEIWRRRTPRDLEGRDYE